MHVLTTRFGDHRGRARASSLGGTRQYSGTLGRTDNCPVAVLAYYCSTKGHTFVDLLLFRPEYWAGGADRCEAAGVPARVISRTKPVLVLEMIADAVVASVPFRWAGGTARMGII